MLFYLSGNSWAISYAGCASQLFFYHFLSCTECFLHIVMAYGRFVAICYPLCYTIIMRHKVCAIVALGTSLFGCIQATFLTTLTFQFPYCGPKEVDYFFQRCWSWLVQIRPPWRRWGSSVWASCPSAASFSSSPPTVALSIPSCRFSLQKADIMPSPPAVPTSLLFYFSTCQWSSSTKGPPQVPDWMPLLRSWMIWSLPCWTPLSTASGIRR